MAGGLNRHPALQAPWPWLRRFAWAALVVAVLAAHGCVTQVLGERMAALSAAPGMPARMEVLYVRELGLAPAAVAAPAAPAAAPSPRAPAARPATAASAPAPAASRARTAARGAEPGPDRIAAAVPDAMPEAARDAQPDRLPAPVDEALPEPTPDRTDSAQSRLPTEPPQPGVTAVPAVEAGPAATPFPLPAQEPAGVSPVSAPEAADAAPPFDWPVSTRVSYRLTGNVRGEVHGDAQVEWVRAGSRYQVHLDVTVGLSFAPLMTRRMSSDGDITAQGLSPRRYDQDTKVGFGARQQAVVLFEPDAVVLTSGQRRERWPGMQDTASQFIQLAYLFTLHPELLRPGGTLDVPLALPRSTSRWSYDVVGEEPVYTPFGPLAAFHLKPRRAVVKGGDLSAEIWFAPQLRNLPVRIRIQQDADTFIDLVMARKPELAAR